MTAVAAPLARAAAWRDVVALLKLRIDALVVAVALAAAVAAGERSAARLGVLALATLASSAGAGAFNHWYDRDVDRLMPRTRGRPVASGRVDPAFALGLAVVLTAAACLAAPVLGAGVCLYLLAGSATYAGVYTVWLKRRTPYGIVWGGAAGSFAALAGWQLAGSTLRPAPQLLALVLFLWTPSHFWSLAIKLEDDYRAAGILALPVVAGPARTARAVFANTLALALSALALGLYLGLAYVAVALPATTGFLLATRALARDPSPARAWSVFKLSGLYLLALLAGVAAAGLV
ncbi:MAG TPA: heme o synthase [Gaiellaceae bacterium]|nr:heme o synthase [Gaiellaceae bacterium]